MQHQPVYRNDHSFCGPIAMLEKLPTGELLLVFREALWRGHSMHADPTTRTSLLRSGDEGATWHSLVTPDPSGGNGTTITALSDGTVIVSNFHWLHAGLEHTDALRNQPGFRELPDRGICITLDGIYTCRSHTDGFTWDAPRKAASDAFFSMTTAGRIVELPDGSLVMPVNGAFAPGGSTCFGVMRSEDRGATWTALCPCAAELPATDLHETRMALLPDGTLVAMHRTANGNFYRSTSADGGATWDGPAETPIWCGGSSPADLLALDDGRLLCTYGHRRPPYGVRASISHDGGRTWDLGREVVLRDDGLDRDIGYPTSIQLDDGSILTVYYWHNNDQIRYLTATRWTLP